MTALGITDECYEYLVGLSPGKTLIKALKILEDSTIPSGTHIDVLAKFLELNQAYTHLLQKTHQGERLDNDWARSQDDEKDALPRSQEIRSGLIRYLRILGPTAAAHSIIALGSHISSRKDLPKKEGDTLKLDIDGRLKHSLAIKELWEEQNWNLPQVAFLGGLHFDWMATCLEEKNAKVDLKKYLSTLWTSSIKIARNAQIIGSFLPDFNCQNAIVPSALFLGLGKLLMAINYPTGKSQLSWVDFEKSLGEPRRDGPFASLIQRVAAEQSSFAITHTEFAALTASFGGIFSSVAPALLHANEPYLLKGRSSDHYSLALVLSVSQEISFHGAKEIKGLHFATKRRLAEFGLKDVEILDQIRKAAQK